LVAPVHAAVNRASNEVSSATFGGRALSLILTYWAQCPLLAQSGHPRCARQCPLLGVKRTSTGGNPISAFDRSDAGHGTTDHIPDLRDSSRARRPRSRGRLRCLGLRNMERLLANFRPLTEFGGVLLILHCQAPCQRSDIFLGSGSRLISAKASQLYQLIVGQHWLLLCGNALRQIQDFDLNHIRNRRK
jgi:hypothetical protein